MARQFLFFNDDFFHIPLSDKGKLFQTNSVRPVHELLVRLELQIFGRHAFGYHLTALILHFIVGIQLYFLTLDVQVNWLNINKPRALQAALLAVVLFLSYAESAETIAWILGRTATLSAIFFLLSFSVLFKQRITTISYLFAEFFFTVALFTYEQAIVLPVAALIIVFTTGDKVLRKQRLRLVLGLCFVSFVYLIVRKFMTSEILGTYEAGNYLAFNFLALFGNFCKIFFRLFLNPSTAIPFVCSVVVLVILMVYTGWKFQKEIVDRRVKISWFVISILFSIAPIVSLGVPINSFESGRYLFLPSLFLLMLVSIGGVSVFYSRPAIQGLLKTLLLTGIVFWLFGKYDAAANYKDASSYSRNTYTKVLGHFKNTSDTLTIDTLNLSIHRLPVFRLGFKTGVLWLAPGADTGRIVVQHYYDEAQVSTLPAH